MEIKKNSLIERAERWQRSSEKRPLIGYQRQNQKEIVKISVAIIKALCEAENLTPHKAKEALRMASDIIEEEAQQNLIL